MKAFKRDTLSMIKEVVDKGDGASAILLNGKGELKDSTFDIMYKRLSWLESLQQNQGVLGVNAKANKVVILHLKSAFTIWLDHMLSNAEMLVHGTPYDPSTIPEWLIKMTWRANRMVNTHEEAVEFHTSMYGIIKEWPEQTCKVARKYMLKVLSSDIIFLDGTWDIFGSATKFMIFQKYTPKIMTDQTCLIPFKDSLKAMAATPEWKECLLYARRIKELLFDVITERIEPQGMFPYAPPHSSTMETIEDPKNKEQVRRGVLFLKYIHEALAILHEEVDGTQASLLQNFILSDQNKNCPFRDCASTYTCPTDSCRNHQIPVESAGMGLESAGMRPELPESAGMRPEWLNSSRMPLEFVIRDS